MGTLSFWSRYLEGVSLLFAGLGLAWAVLGTFDPFGIYERYMAEAFFGQAPLSVEARKVYAFLLGPFGATLFGYFLLQLFIVRNAFARGHSWGYRGVFFPFVAWFVVDTTVSLAHGALFNVLLANLPSLALMVPPLIASRRFFRPDGGPTER